MSETATVSSLDTLLARIAQGDREAWGTLYEGLAPMVAATAMRVTRDPDLVHDAVQEVFLALPRAAGRFRRPADPAAADGAVRSWLAGVAVKTTLYLARRRRNQRRRDRRAGKEDHRQTVTDPVRASDLKDLVRTGLAEMPAHLAAAVSLRYLEGLDYDQIAAAEGISRTNAKVRTHRGLQHLRSWCARGGAAAGLTLLVGTLRAAAAVATPAHPPAPALAAAGTVPTAILTGGGTLMTTIGLSAVWLALATTLVYTTTAVATDDPVPADPPPPAPVLATAEQAGHEETPPSMPSIGIVAAVRVRDDGSQDLVAVRTKEGRGTAKVGDTYIVYRGEYFICEVRVSRVLDDMAFCLVLRDTANTKGLLVKAGDQVTERT